MAVLTVVISAGPAIAQKGDGDSQNLDPFSMSIEELFSLKVETVFAASKHRQTTLQAPSSVSVVTGEEIRRYGYRNLAEILAHVRGFFSTYDRNYTYVGTRGFDRPGDYDSRFLLLINGNRINDNVFDSAPMGTEFPVDLELIDRVEVVRGPSSALYGTSAFFAVINIITKKGKDFHGPLVSVSAGTLGTNSLHTSWGQRFGTTSDFLLSVSRYRSNGYQELHYPEFDSPVSDGIARNQDTDGNETFYSQATLNNFSIQALYGSRTKQIPTGSFGSALKDSRNHTIDWYGDVDGTYRKVLPQGWDFNVRGFYDRSGYDGILGYENNSPNGEQTTSLNKDVARGNWIGQETQFTRKFKSGSILTSGLEFRRNLLQKQENLDLEPEVSVFLDHVDRSNVWAAFVQQELKVTNTLVATFGIRYDHYSTFGGAINPRAAVILNPTPTSAVKILYGQAFRAPNVYELFWHQEGFDFGNSHLRPETIRSAEVVYEKTLNENWTVSVDAFRDDISDLITQSPQTGAPGFVNFGKIHVSGLEGEIERRTVQGFETRLSYAFQASATVETGAPLSNSPRHVIQAKIGDSWARGWVWTGMDLFAMSSRLTLKENKIQGHLVSNFTVATGKDIHGLSLSATLYNATNTHYSDPGSSEHEQDAIGQDGRTLRFKLTYQRK